MGEGGRGFQSETSASTLATAVVLGSEDWALKRYLAMDALEAKQDPQPSRR